MYQIPSITCLVLYFCPLHASSVCLWFMVVALSWYYKPIKITIVQLCQHYVWHYSMQQGYSRFRHLCNRKAARTKTTGVVNLYWTSLYSSTRVVFKVVCLLQGCLNLLYCSCICLNITCLILLVIPPELTTYLNCIH